MFTPIETSIGALLLHQATSVLLFQNGTVLGASGYMRRLFSTPTRGTLAFFVGMAASILPLKLFLPELVTVYPPVPSTLQAALVTVGVGALVGWGTKVSKGCTSGHMLCGLSRLSTWSAVAVATFFPVAIITHHLAHPTLLTEVCASDLPCYTPTYPSRATTISLVILAAATMLACQAFPLIIAKATATEDKTSPDSLTSQASQLSAGLEFGLGLHVTQMASPSKVLGFLSFPNFEVWDPSMALVILFGILPSIIEIQMRGLSKPPLFKERFELPKKTIKDVDWKFVLGAAVFGIGWGLTGTCPGPAVLRTFAQPSWGLLWMSGFWLGGQAVGEGEAPALKDVCR
ncbi:YeeE/YedE family integral membrane protein [Melanomma pulvis-pyrius CBS 109.77]|uniref:YeeE/YedE family integral membrane protein n=1 Tax=Melanomma pulvis-pyrius CBS 109.77 TaxID=1314802 RepID=A0A6A6WP59_9PLEO|nr:YeeE/YedE family integral membrane protein [Melanomma pulvis-pyrius CBS 109.77]